MVVEFTPSLLPLLFLYSSGNSVRVEPPRVDFSMSSGRDGIRSIDAPVFNSIQEAEKWLHAREPVIAFISDEEVKAYPLQILMYHEIVNDQVNGQAIAVTYCPLCNAAMVFARLHNGELLELGSHEELLAMNGKYAELFHLQAQGYV